MKWPRIVAVGGLCAAFAVAATAAPARAQAELQCVSFGVGPQLECTVQLRHAGQPLAGAQVKLGAHMPSMPMAHSVRPVAAAPTSQAGEYRGVLELEMEGVWAVSVDITAKDLRDRIVKALQVGDCAADKRCAAQAPKAPTRPVKQP